MPAYPGAWTCRWRVPVAQRLFAPREAGRARLVFGTRNGTVPAFATLNRSRSNSTDFPRVDLRGSRVVPRDSGILKPQTPIDPAFKRHKKVAASSWGRAGCTRYRAASSRVFRSTSIQPAKLHIRDPNRVGLDVDVFTCRIIGFGVERAAACGVSVVGPCASSPLLRGALFCSTLCRRLRRSRPRRKHRRRQPDNPSHFAHLARTLHTERRSRQRLPKRRARGRAFLHPVEHDGDLRQRCALQRIGRYTRVELVRRQLVRMMSLLLERAVG